MNWLITVILGGISGWLASVVMKTDAQMGVFANVAVGIVGASLGFWLAGILGIAAGGAIVRWIVALTGAVLLIAILKALKILK